VQTWREFKKAEREKRREYWQHALTSCEGNVCAVARLTGYNRTKVYEMLTLLGLHEPGTARAPRDVFRKSP